MRHLYCVSNKILPKIQFAIQSVQFSHVCKSVGSGFELGVEPEVFLHSQAVRRLAFLAYLKSVVAFESHFHHTFFARRVWRKIYRCLSSVLLWNSLCMLYERTISQNSGDIFSLNFIHCFLCQTKDGRSCSIF